MTAAVWVRDEWERRIEAEYRSAAITQNLVLWLIQMGASPDLVHDGLRIVGDEMDHAELSHAVFVEAGGEGPPRIDRGQLGLPRSDGPVEGDVLRYGVQIFCLGETVAVPLFKHLRQGCTVPVAREALDRILRDEVRHRDFGWALLDWFLDQPHLEPMVVAQVTGQLAGMFAGLEASYGAGQRAGSDGNSGGDSGAMASEVRAWGLAPPAEYRAILAETFDREWSPRFQARGIDPTAAWKARLDRPVKASE